jgi:hypothetical protein
MFIHASGEFLGQSGERLFAEITEKQIRPGVHRSTEELETAIRADRYRHRRPEALPPDKVRRRHPRCDRFCLKTLEVASAQVDRSNTSAQSYRTLPTSITREIMASRSTVLLTCKKALWRRNPWSDNDK